MPHATPLITTIVAGLVLAFIFALIAQRLRVPVLIGYLLAGVIVGPFTPGYVADQELANELAELGIILLMFGVGLHFSLKDLLAVRKVAIPGALVQIACAVGLGMGMAHLLGWSMLGAFVFGLALSVASTVVLLRALQERRLVDSDKGRIAVGWLIVEDLVMVIALVLLPVLATSDGAIGELAAALGITLVKVAAFAALMLVVGTRFVPWLLQFVAHSGSRELFRLAVLAIALGVAFGAALVFGVSFALGAFFAGMILAESPLSQRAAEETLPLRDAFAVLFFVSVGMLFNPSIIVTQTLPVLATLGIIVIGKSIAAYLIVRLFGRDNATALTISASLAQIGEFSFILATLGTNLKILPDMARDLIVAGAILSIMVNPLLFALIDWVGKRTTKAHEEPIGGAHAVSPTGHILIVGCGRVGKRVVAGLIGAGEQVTVIDTEAARDGLPDDPLATVIVGNGARPDVLERAGVADARMLFVAIPAGHEAGQVIQQARRRNAALHIVARFQNDAEGDQLRRLGADRAIMGEDEIARRMIDEALVGVH